MRSPGGVVKDPYTGVVINEGDDYVVGHDYGYEEWKHMISGWLRGISRDEYLKEYWEHVRPQTKDSNKSRIHEAPDGVSYWPMPNGMSWPADGKSFPVPSSEAPAEKK